jgi:hypothetical protein
VIQRALWRQGGALALTRRGNEFIVESARARNLDRPWAPARPARETVVNGFADHGKTAGGDHAPDPTPRQEDIEADEQPSSSP